MSDIEQVGDVTQNSPSGGSSVDDDGKKGYTGWTVHLGFDRYGHTDTDIVIQIYSDDLSKDYIVL